MVSHFHGSVVS